MLEQNIFTVFSLSCICICIIDNDSIGSCHISLALSALTEGMVDPMSTCITVTPVKIDMGYHSGLEEGNFCKHIRAQTYHIQHLLPFQNHLLRLSLCYH